jgi:heat shock protein HslJ
VRAFRLLVAAAAACAAPARWDADVLGGEWVLVRIEGAAPLGGTETVLTFAAGRLYGQAGNRYGASYSRDEETLAIGPVVSSRMRVDVPPGAHEQETRYLRLLGEADGWRVSGGRLELLRGDAPVLGFMRRGEARSSPS